MNSMSIPWWHAVPAPPEAAEKGLADQLDLTAWHEAGHAVALVVAGRPLYRVRVAYQVRRHGRSVSWRVSGRSRTSPFLPARDRVRSVTATLAGPEAEARRACAITGVPLSRARAEALQANPDDAHDAARVRRLAGISGTEAAVRAAAVVDAHLDAVARVADLLAVRAWTGQAVTGAEIRAVVSEHTGGRV